MSSMKPKYEPKIVRQWLALTAAVLITVTGGVLYGGYIQRWNPPPDLTAAATRLAKLPREFGSWKVVDDVPIDESTLEMLECAGYVSRRYVNQESGQSVQCAIMVGPPGPIAVHTPEVCYSSQEYEIQNERTRISIEALPSQKHSFWKVDFTTRNALADALRVHYAWTSGREWKASRTPRFEYAGEPRLYKIQSASYVTPDLGDVGVDPGRQFLEEFVRSAWPLVANDKNESQ
jgi:hypothetical protein